MHCEGMFPVLDAVVKYCGDKEDSYQNRYPGFISERLITLYFHKVIDFNCHWNNSIYTFF